MDCGVRVKNFVDRLTSSGAARAVLVAAFAVFALAQTCLAQAAPPPPANPSGFPTLGAAPAPNGGPPSISLSPAVIMARGSYGQGLTQTLTLTNNTSAEFAFEMEAQDVVVQDGKRVYIAAGETQNSIAASAVFSQKQVIVKPYSMVSVDVRLTIPAETKLRAVVALFRGTNRLPTSSSAVGMTASLGALITFNLT